MRLSVALRVWLVGSLVAVGAAQDGSVLLDRLLAVQDDTDHVLHQQTGDISRVTSSVEAIMNELLQEQEAVASLESQLKAREVVLRELVAQLNARQLQHVYKLLEDTVRLELQSRSNSLTDDNDDAAVVVENPIASEELDTAIDADELLDDTEAALQNWMVQVVKDEVLERQVRIAQAVATTKPPSTTRPKKTSELCLTPSDGAVLLEEGFIAPAPQKENGVNLLEKATVVHDLTSESYVPPPLPESDLLGNVWWRRYIPQDWERLLPAGWETWNVATPSAHYRPMNLVGMLPATIPPEAILDTNNLHPGACWPIAGNKGYVTLQLAQPMQQFESITIAHSPLLWQNGAGDSTPKKMQIIGYPPCKSWCNGRDFDVRQGKVLTAFDFDTTSTSSSQTFEAFGELPQEGSCSEVQPSCDAPADPLETQVNGTDAGESTIAAIRIAIDSNQGNMDYTCLYGARLQGTVA